MAADAPIRYIDRTRDYYAALGYPAPYRWAENAEVPFQPLARPLGACRVALITTAAGLSVAIPVYFLSMWFEARVDVFSGQDLAGRVVHQQPGLGADRLGCRRGGQRRRRDGSGFRGRRRRLLGQHGAEDQRGAETGDQALGLAAHRERMFHRIVTPANGAVAVR